MERGRSGQRGDSPPEVGGGVPAADGGGREEVAAAILACQHDNALYPRDHPRVRSALRSLRERIVSRCRAIGRSLILDSREDLDGVRGFGPPAAFHSDALKRLLKLNLIERVTIGPAVTDEELFGFVYLLDDGLPRAEKRPEIDTADWDHIALSFYREMDSGPSPDPSPILERSAGIARPEQLAAVLEDVPDGVREAVLRALRKPEFLARISALRSALRSPPAGEGSPARKVDVIGEVCRIVLRRVRAVEGDELGPEEVRSTIGNCLDSIAENLDEFAARARSSDGAGRPLPPLPVVERIDIAPRAPDAADRFQVIRHGLASLFSSATNLARGIPAGEAGPPPPRPEDPGAARGGSPDPAGPDPALDFPAAGAEAGVGPGSEAEEDASCLDTLGELLVREESRLHLGSTWKTVVGNLTSDPRSPQHLERLVGRLSDLLAETKLPELEPLLVSVLAGADDLSRSSRLTEEILVPRWGFAIAHRVVDHLSDHDGRKAIAFLSAWAARAGPAFPPPFEEKLIALARRGGFLASWASSHPATLLDPRRLPKVLDRVPPASIREAFDAFFATAEPERAAALLEAVPPGIEKSELILFSAFNHGTPATRLAAIGNLWKPPDPSAVRTLVEIVRLNNRKEKLDPSEVRAALSSLLRCRDERAATFIREVLGKRGILGHTYLAKIREILGALRGEGTP